MLRITQYCLDCLLCVYYLYHQSVLCLTQFFECDHYALQSLGGSTQPLECACVPAMHSKYDSKRESQITTTCVAWCIVSYQQ